MAKPDLDKMGLTLDKVRYKILLVCVACKYDASEGTTPLHIQNHATYNEEHNGTIIIKELLIPASLEALSVDCPWARHFIIILRLL